jgi:hypothetical protein
MTASTQNVTSAPGGRIKRWGPTVIVVALLTATAVAFATTERQKLEKTPFAVLEVTQAFSPKRAAATIRLRLRRPHLVTIVILDSHDRQVATLVREQRVEPGIVEYHWKATAPDGVYTPRVTLDTGREFTLPRQIRVDSVAPRTRLVAYRPHVLRPGAKPTVTISYRVNEKAHVIVYANGRRVAVSFAKALSSKVNWQARRYGDRLPRGRYHLELAAVDLAGNIGARTPVFIVRIR